MKTWFSTFTYRGEFAPGYAEVQKALKRLRKNTGKALRYLCATEVGELGRLHYHLLVHGSFTRREIDGAWKAGFSHTRLVRSSRVSSYVSKYTSKSGGRIRASSRYGYAAARKMLAEDDRVKAVFDAFPLAQLSRVSSVSVFGKVAKELVDFKAEATSPRALPRRLAPSELADFREAFAEAETCGFVEGGHWWANGSDERGRPQRECV